MVHKIQNNGLIAQTPLTFQQPFSSGLSCSDGNISGIRRTSTDPSKNEFAFGLGSGFGNFGLNAFDSAKSPPGAFSSFGAHGNYLQDDMLSISDARPNLPDNEEPVIMSARPPLPSLPPSAVTSNANIGGGAGFAHFTVNGITPAPNVGGNSGNQGGGGGNISFSSHGGGNSIRGSSQSANRPSSQGQDKGFSLKSAGQIGTQMNRDGKSPSSSMKLQNSGNFGFGGSKNNNNFETGLSMPCVNGNQNFQNYSNSYGANSAGVNQSYGMLPGGSSGGGLSSNNFQFNPNYQQNYQAQQQTQPNYSGNLSGGFGNGNVNFGPSTTTFGGSANLPPPSKYPNSLSHAQTMPSYPPNSSFGMSYPNTNATNLDNMINAPSFVPGSTSFRYQGRK